MSTITVELYNEYNTDEQLYLDSGEIITCQDSNHNAQYASGDPPYTFEWADGTVITISLTKSGYSSYTSSAITVNGAQTVKCYLVPQYKFRQQWRRYSSSGTSTSTSTVTVTDAFTATIYELVNGELILYDTCHSHNANGYFWTNKTIYSTDMRIRLETDNYWPRWAKVGDNPNTFATFEKTRTLIITPTYYDAETNEPVDMTAVTNTAEFEKRYYNVPVGDEWGNGSTISPAANTKFACPTNQLYSSQTLHGYLLDRGTAGNKTKVKFTTTPLIGYEQTVLEHDFSENGTPIEYYSFPPVALHKPAVYQIAVVDGLTDEPLTGYTATVTKGGETIEVSTDGYFYTPWDGTSVYDITVTKEGYEPTGASGTAYPTPSIPMSMFPVPQYGHLTVEGAHDINRGTPVTDATITVTNISEGTTVQGYDGVYTIVANYGYSYLIEARKGNYYGSEVVTPTGDVTVNVGMLPDTVLETDLYVSVVDEQGDPVTGATITVRNVDYNVDVEEEDGKYPVIYNDNVTYRITVSKQGYFSYETTVTPTTADDITVTAVLALPHAELTVNVYDDISHALITPDDIKVRSITHGTYVEPVGGVYWLTKDEPYRITVAKHGYITPDAVDVTPTTDAPITQAIYMLPLMPLNVIVTDGDEPLEDAEVHIYDNTDLRDIWYDDEARCYPVPVGHMYIQQSSCAGYTTNIEYDVARSTMPLTVEVELRRATARLIIAVTDGEQPLSATLTVYDETAGREIPYDGGYNVPIGHYYTVTAECEGYTTVQTTPAVVPDEQPISITIVLKPEVAVLKVRVTNGTDPLPATVTVYDQTDKVAVIYDADVHGYEIPVGHDYDVTAECDGYYSQTTPTRTAETAATISVTITLEQKPIAYATVQEYEQQTGKALSDDDEKRVEQLLLDVSDVIREEGLKYKVDVDSEIELRRSYRNVVRTITIDVTDRAMRQDPDSEPMAQESQAALGYSWSGTYAVAGGGVAVSLMNNEMKLLGFKQQQMGDVQLWHR